MNINKKIDIFDFTEIMQSMVNYLEGAFPKMTSVYDMALYKMVPISQNVMEDEFAIFNMDVENEMQEFEDVGEGAYNLICLNYKEGMPVLYASNIIFFENTNKTLPLGMNLSSRVLVDTKKLEFSLVNKTKFRTNSYFGNEEAGKLQLKDIFVYEYDVFRKEEAKEANVFNVSETVVAPELLETKVENSAEEPKEPETEKNKTEELVEVSGEPASEEGASNQPEEPVVKKSKRLLKIEQKYEKEMEKQQKKEEKARRKKEKKKGKGE